MSSYVKSEKLSVKQIKQILKHKNIDYSSVVEKRDLIFLVEKNVPTAKEARDILTLSKTSGSKTSGSTTSSIPPTSNPKKAYEKMSKMSPAQMKYQAQSMRRDPSLVRRMQPALCTFNKIALIKIINIRSLVEAFYQFTPGLIKL